MDALEVAVGELVVALGVARGIVVDAQEPLAVLGEAMLLEVPVLVLRRRLLLAPVVPVVENPPALFDQTLSVLFRVSVQPHRHTVTSFVRRRGLILPRRMEEVMTGFIG